MIPLAHRLARSAVSASFVVCPAHNSSILPPRKRRRLFQSFAYADSFFDAGVDLTLRTGDTQQDLAESIIEERRRDRFSSMLPNRVEVRFLPPHMMRFPTQMSQDTHLLQQKDGLPERPSRLDQLLFSLAGRMRRKRRQETFSGVALREDGDQPRVAWLQLRTSVSYATSFPYVVMSALDRLHPVNGRTDTAQRGSKTHRRASCFCSVGIWRQRVLSLSLLTYGVLTDHEYSRAQGGHRARALHRR